MLVFLLVVAEADVTALRLCQDWLQSAITFVMETDHNIEQLVFAEPGSNVAADWVPLAQNTILQVGPVVGCGLVPSCGWVFR